MGNRKNIICVFLFCISLLYNLKGQTFDNILGVKYQTGYAVLNNNDTIQGVFEFNDCEQNYKLLVYLDPLTRRKIAYNPQEISLFVLNDKIFKPVELKYEWFFMRVILEDELKVYLHKNFYTIIISSGVNTEIYMIKPNDEKLLVSFDNFFPFKTKLANFVEDCADLVQKINNDVYVRKDILQIAQEYNEFLKSK